MVMELLGSNLEKRKAEKDKLSMRSVALIGKQIFNILESLHNHGYLHRDIKP